MGSIGETLAFLLSQVESVAKDGWDPEAERKIDGSLWRRASAFSTLFGTRLVRRIPRVDPPIYCCSPRADPDGDDVCNREAINAQQAQESALAFLSQRRGADVTIEELAKFAGPTGARVFGFQDGVAYCSCPAFYHPRRCLRTIGLHIFLGKVEVPGWLDETRLSLAARGNKPKAPGRGAVPLKADEKDLRIARLEATARRMTDQKSKRGAKRMATPPAPSWKPARRLRAKTSQQSTHTKACEAAAPAKPPRTTEEVVALPVADADDEQRSLQNAIALVADLEMLESDPGVGKGDVELPVGSPRLAKELLVAENGRRFTLCCLAARGPVAWAAVARKPDGTPVRLEQLIAEDDSARSFLLTELLAAGMPGERVGELVLGSYAEAKDFVFFAAAMGGAIGVVPPVAGQDVQKERFFGNGPLRLQVQLYYLPGNQSPHYKLLQSWF